LWSFIAIGVPMFDEDNGIREVTIFSVKLLPFYFKRNFFLFQSCKKLDIRKFQECEMQRDYNSYCCKERKSVASRAIQLIRSRKRHASGQAATFSRGKFECRPMQHRNTINDRKPESGVASIATSGLHSCEGTF
jgi:hypothetical protein